MRKDLTDITVVLDRSGSMETIRADAEGGLHNFVEDQKKLPGEALYSLVQFDTSYEFVHKGVPINDVQRHKLVPRGSTALLDAVGRAIVETGERLNGIAEDQRPGLVVFVIITDGEENSSREYSLAQLKKMIETQQSIYKWQFTFLGANQDAFAEAGGMGIPTMAAANYTQKTAGKAFAAASGNVMRMRHAAFSGAPVISAYSDEERAAMSDDD